MSRGRTDLSRKPLVWSGADDALLIRLWSENKLSVVAITEEMTRLIGYAFTKNQILGRAHRLIADGQIKSKGNPVTGPRSGARAVEAARAKTVRSVGAYHPEQQASTWTAVALAREQRTRLAGNHAAQNGNAMGLGIDARRLQINAATHDQRAIDKATESKLATFTPRLPAPERCCWPLDKKGPGKGWTFCEALSVPGKVYCAEHHQRAYVFKEVPAAPAQGAEA